MNLCSALAAYCFFENKPEALPVHIEESRQLQLFAWILSRTRVRNDNGTVFKPNDRYPLTKDVFRLYYTSLSADRQTVDVYVEDNFGRVQKLTFSFNNEKTENKEKSSATVIKVLKDADN